MDRDIFVRRSSDAGVPWARLWGGDSCTKERYNSSLYFCKCREELLCCGEVCSELPAIDAGYRPLSLVFSSLIDSWRSVMVTKGEERKGSGRSVQAERREEAREKLADRVSQFVPSMTEDGQKPVFHW